MTRVRGCSLMMSCTEGGEGLWQKVIFDTEGGRRGPPLLLHPDHHPGNFINTSQNLYPKKMKQSLDYCLKIMWFNQLQYCEKLVLLGLYTYYEYSHGQIKIQ